MFKNVPFVIYEQGGSCCNRYISSENSKVFIKEIRKNINGIDNGYKKFYFEIEHMKDANENYKGLYPEIYYVDEDEQLYSVGMEYCFNGVTFADLIRNSVFSVEYCQDSLKYIIKLLIKKLYIPKTVRPNENYVQDNYLERVRKRMHAIKELDVEKNYGFSEKLRLMDEEGFYLNNEFYPPVLDYIHFIESDKNLLSKLEIHKCMNSHHDLIPGNILIKIGENNIADFKLIDPRGEAETGEHNRHFMYDLGKLLLGIDCLDIFRIFNGTLSQKKYNYSFNGRVNGKQSFSLAFDERDPIIKKYSSLYDYCYKLLCNNLSLMNCENNLELKLLFAQACMYHPDISCRIIDECNEEMAICFYLRGSMIIRKFMNAVYGSDPLIKSIKV